METSQVLFSLKDKIFFETKINVKKIQISQRKPQNKLAFWLLNVKRKKNCRSVGPFVSFFLIIYESEFTFQSNIINILLDIKVPATINKLALEKQAGLYWCHASSQCFMLLKTTSGWPNCLVYNWKRHELMDGRTWYRQRLSPAFTHSSLHNANFKNHFES